MDYVPIVCGSCAPHWSESWQVHFFYDPIGFIISRIFALLFICALISGIFFPAASAPPAPKEPDCAAILQHADLLEKSRPPLLPGEISIARDKSILEYMCLDAIRREGSSSVPPRSADPQP